MAIRFSSLARRVAVACVAAAVFLSAAKVSPADDATAARRELQSSDFRVRVGGALTLGRVRPPGARDALERALADENAAVRAAAAAGLLALGDPAAVGALERQAARESSPSARGQMRLSLENLRKIAAVNGAKFIVQLGSMRNNTSVRGSQLGYVLHDAAMSRAQQLPGVVVADGGADRDVLRVASERHLPVLTIDGSLTGLTQTQTGGDVRVRAQVLFSIRKEQTLKASLQGAATASVPVQALARQDRVAQLQDDAVDGAVQSALRGAPAGMTIASR